MKTAGFHTILSLAILWQQWSSAQSPVQQYTAVYVPSGSTASSYTAKPASCNNFSSCSNTNFTYNWNSGTDNLLRLNSFVVNGKTYVVSPPPLASVKLRRVNNSNVSGKRTILYSEITGTPANACPGTHTLNFRTPYQDTMELALNNNVLSHGTDNIFTNAGNGDNNNNDIERVDVIFPLGVYTSFVNDAGFGLFERGNNNAHDGVRIAAILSLDVNGDPATFGNVKTCVAGNGSNNGSWGHPSIANGNHLVSAYVLRKDEGDNYLRVSSSVNQEIGGVFFSFADLGVGFNQKIYGYTLIGPDGVANPASAQLLDLNNTEVYPTGTTEGDGGGLDLISVNTYFGTNQALADNGLQTFSGEKAGIVNLLHWDLPALSAGNRVQLERSADGISYQVIYSYETNDAVTTGQFRDPAADRRYFYRLKIQLVSGSTEISKVIALGTAVAGTFKAGPNPAIAGALMNLTGLPAGTYRLMVLNMSGGLEYQAMITVTGTNTTFRLPERLKTGVYLLQLEDQGVKWGDPVRLLITGK